MPSPNTCLHAWLCVSTLRRWCVQQMPEFVWDARTRLIFAPPPSETTRAFRKELTSGVARLHELRIVHRDLKPHNILLASMDPPSHMESESKEGEGEGGADAVPRTRSRSWKRKPSGCDVREHHKLGVRWRPKVSCCHVC